MRVFIGQLGTETNTFAPMPTTMASFEDFCLVREGSRDPSALSFLGGFRRRAEADGHEVIETISAFAQPSGRTLKGVYETLRDIILDDLAAAGPVDMVLLGLHGAMVAQGYDDCEGDILARVRKIAPAAVVGALLDPHCHLTRLMAETADVIVLGKEYPHTDFAERADELYDLCHRAALGTIAPVAALVDTSVVGFFPTYAAPMDAFVADLKAAEAEPGVLSVSFVHGFPWADVADVGSRLLVYADGDANLATTVAERFAGRLYAERADLAPAYPSLEAAWESSRVQAGVTVWGDFADNPGGGGPGDSTHVLRFLLDRSATNAVVGALCDPVVAQICAEAGVGARLDVRLGGKTGPASGDPLDLTVEVRAVNDDFSAPGLNFSQPMGRTVWLRCDGVDITVCSLRAQIFNPRAFTDLGLSLDGMRLIVVKSAAHFQAAFGPIADALCPVTAPGAMSADFATLPYTLRPDDFFPREQDPWRRVGRPEPLFEGSSSRARTGAA